MARKFDATKVNTGSKTVIGEIAQATSKRGQQGTATPQEQAERAAKGQTQGRKGCKAVRINMAFTPDNYEYIQRMAKLFGKTMTAFANQIIETYREEHGEMFDESIAAIYRMKDKAQQESGESDSE